MRDFRYAFRSLRRSPVVFSVAILILALGIGANTAVFSALNHVLIQPLPFLNPDQLVIFGQMNRARGIRAGLSRESFEVWTAHVQSFEALGALFDDQVFPLPGHRQSLHGARVSTNFFEVLGVRPAIGRSFVASDGQPQAPNVVLISDGLWFSRWGRDPGVLGQTLDMSNRKYTVIGVLPPGFRMLYSTASVWVPLEPQSARGVRALFAIGRLRPSVTLASVCDELTAALPLAEPGWTVWGKPLREYIVGDRRPLALLLFAAVSLMLVTACMNVGAVLIARATGRLKDTTIRVCLGAGRWRIVRESLAEVLILSGIGSLAGLAVASVIRTIAVAAVPELRDFIIDRTVLAFTVVLTLFVALIVASGPALVSSRALAGATARNATRLRGAFVAAQTALAVALLVSMGVLVRSLEKLRATDPGFGSSGIVVAEIDLPAAADDPARAREFVRVALERAASQPHVQSVAASTAMPLFGPDSATLNVEGRAGQEPFPVAQRSISPEYFRLFDIPLRLGRQFSSADQQNSPPVAILNERAAQLLFPDRDMIGRQVRFSDGDWVTVVGVAANTHSVGLRRPAIPEIFVPFAQHPTERISLALRIDGEPAASIPALSDVVSATDSRASVTYANSMSALLDEQLALVRALSAFGAVFALISTLLAGMGLYGAISCLYAQRTKEIGIRLAIGATPGSIVRMVATSSAWLAGTGCLAGILAGAAAGRIFQAAEFGVAGVDGLILAGAVGITLAIVIVATYAPAARAARIDPASAIRSE